MDKEQNVEHFLSLIRKAKRGHLKIYIGMIAGVGLTEGINFIMENAKMGQSSSSDDMSTFLNPTVDLTVALMSTLLIVGAGVLAGYFPARKAVKITAIEAMRNE